MRIQTVNSSQTYLLPLFCIYEQLGLCVGRLWRLANTIRTQTTSRSVKVVVLNIDQNILINNNPLLNLITFLRNSTDPSRGRLHWLAILVVAIGSSLAWADRDGGRGSGPPENHKNIGFPSNIDPDSPKITNLRSQHSMVGHYWHASGRHFNGVSLAGR